MGTMEPMHDAAGEDLRAHDRFVRRLAQRLVTNADDADDVAQDAWVVALTREWPKTAAFGAWLAGIARNVSWHRHRDRARAAARAHGLGEDCEVIDSNSPLDLVARIELERRLLDRVLALSEPRRSIVLLRLREDLTSAQVGAKLGLPEGTVRWHLKAALEELRARLDAEHEGKRHAWWPGLLEIATRAAGPEQIGRLLPPTHAQPWVLRLLSKSFQGLLAMKIQGSIAALAMATIVAVAFIELESGETESARRAESRSASPTAAPLLQDDAAATVDRTREGATPATTASATIPALTIVGRCVDELGAPLPDVAVLLGFAESEPSIAEHASVDPTTTGADGRFRMGVDPPAGAPAAQVVRFAKDGRIPRILSTFEPIGESVDLGDIVLEPGLSIEGRVVDDHGRPVAGATISTSTEFEFSPFSRETDGLELSAITTQTDEGGRFRLEGLSPGWVLVVANARDYVITPSAPIGLEKNRPVHGVEIVLPSLGERRIEGRCLDELGNPVPHANLSDSFHVGNAGGSRGIETDPDGRFHIRTLEPVPHLLTFEHEGQVVSAADVMPGTLDVVLQIAPAPRAQLRVRDRASGEPIEAFEAEVWQFVAEGLGSSVSVPGSNHPGGKASFVRPSARCRVEVRAPGYLDGASPEFEPDVIPSEIVMDLAPAAPIRGIVQANGVAVADARVVLLDASGSMEELGFVIRAAIPYGGESSAITSADGRFAIRGMGLGPRIFVRAEAKGYAATQVGPFEWPTGILPDPIVVDLSRGGSIEGEVRVAKDRSRTGIAVAASNGFGKPLLTRTDARGAFHFVNLTPGPWEVELRTEEPDPRFLGRRIGSPSNAPIPSNCTVVADATTRIDLTMDETGARISGRVVSKAALAPGFVVTAYPIVDREVFAARSKSHSAKDPEWVEGAIRAPVLPDGSFDLDVRSMTCCRLVLSDEIRSFSPTVRIEALVDLAPGRNRFDFEARFGRIEIPAAAKADAKAVGSDRVEWWKGSSLTCFAAGEGYRRADGGLTLEFVPEGAVDVRIDGVWTTVNVREGETTRID